VRDTATLKAPVVEECAARYQAYAAHFNTWSDQSSAIGQYASASFDQLKDRTKVHMYDIADLPSVACIHLAVACDWCDAAALSSVDGRCAKQVGHPADVADDRQCGGAGASKVVSRR
jgi:hypothetical protein